MNKKDSLWALKKAIIYAGGQSALARKMGDVRQCHIWSWLNRNKRVPASQVIKLEKAVDGIITRHDFRPDLYPLDTA